MKVLLGEGEPRSTGDTPPVDKRVLARFLEEAQVTGQLDHPGIVPVHELGIHPDGRIYFTMKLVKGKTLAEVFDELHRGDREWTRPRVLGLILRVCEAVSYAHAKHVIHRDLKPANVMVGKFGEVYVMDWGLAKILGRDEEKDIRIRELPKSSEVVSDRREYAYDLPDSPLYTMDGDVVGTPAYMPPEQAAGRVWEMGPASDVYAVGAMLYHLLSGHMPYVPDGARISPYAVLARVQEGPPRPLEELAPDAPRELVAICKKAMDPRIDGRYAGMQDLADDLRAFMDGRTVKAHAPALIHRLLKAWSNLHLIAKLGILLAYLGIACLWLLDGTPLDAEREAVFASQVGVVVGLIGAALSRRSWWISPVLLAPVATLWGSLYIENRLPESHDDRLERIEARAPDARSFMEWRELIWLICDRDPDRCRSILAELCRRTAAGQFEGRGIDDVLNVALSAVGRYEYIGDAQTGLDLLDAISAGEMDDAVMRRIVLARLSLLLQLKAGEAAMAELGEYLSTTASRR